MSYSSLIFFNPTYSFAPSLHDIISKLSPSLICSFPNSVQVWISMMIPPRISVLKPKFCRKPKIPYLLHSFHFYKRTLLNFTMIAKICNLTSTNNNYTTLHIRAFSAWNFCCCAYLLCCWGFTAWNFCHCTLWLYCCGWFCDF